MPRLVTRPRSSRLPPSSPEARALIPAPESSHAIKPAIDEALRCRQTGEAKTIFISLSGHGFFDLAAYDSFNDGKLEDYEYPEELVKQSLAKLPKSA